MKILGTLTVDTPNALDKVTDLNADLLDGKSSELFLSRSSTTGVYIADTAIVIDNSITPTEGGGRLKIYDRDSTDATVKGLSIGALYSATDNVADITTIDADLHISLATDKVFKLFTNVTGVSSTNRLTVLANGNVGINKATPTAKLQVHVGATETTLHPLLITASTKTLFDVDFSGNIGINTAADSNVQLLLQGTRTSTHGYSSYGIKNDLTYVAPTNAVASIYSMYIGTTIEADTNFATAAALFINPISVTGGASTTKYGIYQAGANDSNIFNGNVGIGTTPSTWSSGKVLEIGSAGNALWGNSPANMHLTENTYYNGGWKYASANPAATYQLVTNHHIWSIAPTGSINATVTFTEAMRINSNGNVGIGTLTTPSKLSLYIYDESASIPSALNIGSGTGGIGDSGAAITFTKDINHSSPMGRIYTKTAYTNGAASRGKLVLSCYNSTYKDTLTIDDGLVVVDGNVLATGTVSGSNIFTQYHWSFTIATTNTSGCTIKSNTYDTALCSSSAFYKRTALNTSLGTSSTVNFSTYLICVYIMAGIGNWEIVYPDIVIESGGVIAITFASDQHNNIFKVVMV